MGQKYIFLFLDRTRRRAYPIRRNLAEWGWSLGTSQGTLGKAVGPAVDCDPLFLFCHLWTVGCSLMQAGDSGLAAGCSCIFFACLIFFFLKAVACTLFCHSLCGDGTLNFCLEKCNDFTLFCMLFQQLFDVSVL